MLHKHKQSNRHHSNQLKCVETLRCGCVFSAHRHVQLGVVGVLLITHSITLDNSVPSFSIVFLCIMQLCEYVFPIGLPLYVPKNGVFRGFESEAVKILSSDPQRHYPA